MQVQIYILSILCPRADRIYILSALGQMIDKKDTGLYRDDGLIILRNCDGPTTDRIRKDIIRIFKQIGFKI